MSISILNLFFLFFAVSWRLTPPAAAHDDPPFRELQFLPNLRYFATGSIQLRSDEPDSNFSFGELFLSHPIVSLKLNCQSSTVIDEFNVDWFLVLIDTIYYES